VIDQTAGSVASTKPFNVNCYRLLGPTGAYESETPGQRGGNRWLRIYGRLDCPSARRTLDKGGYKSVRVFFADEAAAIASGFRPCGNCLPEALSARAVKQH
jgi:hypothetical protein